MPKLKLLTSHQIIKILESFNFIVVSQRGSHIKLKRIVSLKKQILVIPHNGTLKKGTLKAIFNQMTKFISKEEIHSFFYTK